MPNIAIIPDSATMMAPFTAVVDGFPDGTHKAEALVGGEPLEDGREATDHVVARQKQFTCTGWVSDFNGGNRQAEALATAFRLQDTQEPFSVMTEWYFYEEMILHRFEAPQSSRGMRFTMELREILRVGIVDTELPAEQLSGPAEGRSGEVARGRVQLRPAL